MPRKALGKGLDALIPGGGDDAASAARSRESIGRPGEEAVVVKIRLSEIEPNPWQPRQDFDRDSLEELAASIKQKGVLQPILLRRGEEGYELVAGERRFRAARLAGLRTIPAIVYDIDSVEDMLELSLIENVHREDLNAVDTARAYRQLADECSLTQEQIAERVGKSRTAIANTLRLLNLPDEVLTKIRKGDLGEGHARALLGLPTKKAQVELARRVVRAGLSVREVERLVRRIVEGEDGPKRKKEKILSPLLAAVLEEMQRTLGTKVMIAGSEKKGKLTIEYYSADDLTRICDRLDITLD